MNQPKRITDARRRASVGVLAILIAVSLSLPVFADAAPSAARKVAIDRAAGEAGVHGPGRTLVVVQMQGGNDGLNTIIPYSDPRYYTLRPTLAIPRKEVIKLDANLGLNPHMMPLLTAWKEHQLAIVLGVGYPNPIRSHFRGTDIWETGSGSGQVLLTGWLDRVVRAAHLPRSLIADGVILGGLGQGPLAGPDIRTISMSDPAQFIVAARQLQALNAPAAASGSLPAPAASPAAAGLQVYGTGPMQSPTPLQLLTTIQVNLTEAADRMAALREREPHLSTPFPKTRFGREMKNAAELIAMGADVPVIKVQIGGFDTHWNQLARQNAVLQDLSDSLSAFRTAMIEAGRWNEVLVMTYSEFGRRVMENGSRGTDHGTAEPLFLLGGDVTGGFYGKEPPLTNLDVGDLRFTTDYRSVYLTVAERWFGLHPKVATLFPGTRPGELAPLSFLHG